MQVSNCTIIIFKCMAGKRLSDRERHDYCSRFCLGVILLTTNLQNSVEFSSGTHVTQYFSFFTLG